MLSQVMFFVQFSYKCYFVAGTLKKKKKKKKKLLHKFLIGLNDLEPP